MLDTLTKHIAKSTMKLKERNSCLSFVSLVWRDDITIVMFNNLNDTVMTALNDAKYQDNDLILIQKLIKDFLK